MRSVAAQGPSALSLVYFFEQECGSDTWIRTRDPLINSQLLYR
jgi:hypothetical protein